MSFLEITKRRLVDRLVKSEGQSCFVGSLLRPLGAARGQVLCNSLCVSQGSLLGLQRLGAW